MSVRIHDHDFSLHLVSLFKFLSAMWYISGYSSLNIWLNLYFWCYHKWHLTFFSNYLLLVCRNEIGFCKLSSCPNTLLSLLISCRLFSPFCRFSRIFLFYVHDYVPWECRKIYLSFSFIFSLALLYWFEPLVQCWEVMVVGILVPVWQREVFSLSLWCVRSAAGVL